MFNCRFALFGEGSPSYECSQNKAFGPKPISQVRLLAIKGRQLNIKFQILHPFGRFIVLNRDKGLLLFKYL